MKKTFFFLTFVISIFTACDRPHKSKNIVAAHTSIGYNLTAPDRVYTLPDVLQEISGITELDSSMIACIQDEREIVYLYDLNSGQIIRHIKYGHKGDYEGIARVDSTLYILRSDGMLSEILNFESDKSNRSTYTTGIPWKDNEGLCYDKKNNILLITHKEIPGKGSGSKNKRFIYGFSLISKQLIQEPVFTIDLSVIGNFALEHTIEVPMKNQKKDKKKEPDIKFLISALAIHPITGRLFLLSSADKLLFVFNTNNEIEYMESLNPDLFRQPEGITFMKNGDMYISNEGSGKSAKLLRFNYKPAANKPAN